MMAFIVELTVEKLRLYIVKLIWILFSFLYVESLKKTIQRNFWDSNLHQTENIFKIWQHVRSPEPHVVGFGAPAEARRDQTLTHVYLHRYCAPVKCSTLHLTCQLRNGAVLSRYQNTLLVLQRYPALSSAAALLACSLNIPWATLLWRHLPKHSSPLSVLTCPFPCAIVFPAHLFW